MRAIDYRQKVGEYLLMMHAKSSYFDPPPSVRAEYRDVWRSEKLDEAINKLTNVELLDILTYIGEKHGNPQDL